jgi:hypothetical protein
MVGYSPDRLIAMLTERCPPERVHTVVLWTKRPRNLVEYQPLRRCLERYSQLYIHLTVSGMGGTPLEGGIPPADDVLAGVPEVVRLAGDPRRVRLRFDPIVNLVLPDGRNYTNLPFFGRVLETAAALRIPAVTTSWMTPYPKVLRHLESLGIRAVLPSPEQVRKQARALSGQARDAGVRLDFCCVPELPVSRCIDGALLSRFHPEGLHASTRKAGGQRPHCGCTESWDIGWYTPCPGRCVYCYANPVMPDGLGDMRGIRGWDEGG